MGEVAPVRSQSLLRALTSLADPPGPPVLALLTPSAPLVLVGRDGELGAGEIEACRSARVPALPWPGRGVRRIDRGRLLFYLTADPATVRESGWPVLEADASRMRIWRRKPVSGPA